MSRERESTTAQCPLHLSPLHAIRSVLMNSGAGASGAGRTTFINTLVEQPLLKHRSQSLLSDPSSPHSSLDPAALRNAAENAHVEEGFRIKPVNVELDEEGVRIALTIVDTPGFGDGVDNEYW